MSTNLERDEYESYEDIKRIEQETISLNQLAIIFGVRSALIYEMGKKGVFYPDSSGGHPGTKKTILARRRYWIKIYMALKIKKELGSGSNWDEVRGKIPVNFGRFAEESKRLRSTREWIEITKKFEEYGIEIGDDLRYVKPEAK